MMGSGFVGFDAMKFVLSVLLSVALWALAGVVSANFDTVNVVEHGTNCDVSSEVDWLTDETSHNMACNERTAAGTDVSGLFLLTKRDWHFFLVLYIKGLSFHGPDEIAAAYRIDKGPVTRKNGKWDAGVGGDGMAIIYMDDIDSLLGELAAGSYFVLKLGEKTVRIPLNGSASAVTDFKERLGLQNE